MTERLHLPDDKREKKEMQRRIDLLERRLAARSNGRQDDIVFNRPGEVTVSTSGRWYPRAGGRLIEVIASLTTAGSTSTVFNILVNGVAEVTGLTIDAGDTLLRSSIDLDVDREDYVQVQVVTAGTGARDITVQCGFL